MVTTGTIVFSYCECIFLILQKTGGFPTITTLFCVCVSKDSQIVEWTTVDINSGSTRNTTNNHDENTLFDSTLKVLFTIM